MQFNKTETRKMTRERTMVRRSWRSHLFVPWIYKNWDKTRVFLIVLDGATSHITAYLRKSSSSSKIVSKLHEWMDTFQMNPKANGSDIAFHHPHDMQAFNRMHDVKSLPTGPHTLEPNRVEMSVRLQIFSGTRLLCHRSHLHS